MQGGIGDSIRVDASRADLEGGPRRRAEDKSVDVQRWRAAWSRKAKEDGARSVALVSINFAPELTGISVYSTGLADYLTGRGYNVVVYTGFAYYPQWSKRREDRRTLFREEERKGVRLRRSYVFVPRRPSVLRRILHELSFVVSATVSYVLGPRADVTVIVSPPLALGLPIALCAWLRRSRTLFHVQDLQPDAAEELGMMRPGPLLTLLRRVESMTYRSAGAVSTISAGMLNRIREKGVAQGKLVLLPNWANDDLVRPLPPGMSYRSEWGLQGKFVILYAGNMGVKQGLESVLETALRLKGDREVAFLIVGDGGEKERLQQRARELELDNLQFQTLQPAEALAQLLATADIAIVPQRRGVTDIVLPSKIGNLMCSARPLVVAAMPGTEVERVILEAGCGLVVPPEDSAAMAEAIVALRRDAECRNRMGLSGFHYATERLAATPILEHFESWLREWADRRLPSPDLAAPPPAN
jgi:colanic acid biosynthesis glycosyl transferase WcaI